MDGTLYLMELAESKLKMALEDLAVLKADPDESVAFALTKIWKDIERCRKNLHAVTKTVAEMKGERYDDGELEQSSQRSRKSR